MILGKAVELANSFGMLYEDEVYALYVLAKMLPENPKVANFGAGTGTSGLVIRTARQDAKIWTIDISESSPYGGLENERNAFTNAGVIDQLPNQIFGCSWDIGKGWQYGDLDMVFIDGDHSYEGCSKDIEAWLPHIKKNGIIVFHDYERDHWADVKRSVDEHTKDKQAILHIRTLKAFWV